MISKERKSFEEYALEIEQGRRPEGNIQPRQFTDDEVEMFNIFIEQSQTIERTIPQRERLLKSSHLNETLSSAESFPISIFSFSESIGDNRKAGSYKKLRISKEILLPEHQERFANVTVPTIEFDVWMLNALEEKKRAKVLKTIEELEANVGIKVRFEGVVGK